MGIVAVILGFIGLIVIHELGHMLVAKALGVRVTDFAVGFGPPLVQKKFGETRYSFRPILLGGFARMAGMTDQDEEEGSDTYKVKPPWRKALIIFAGPFANLLATIVILAGVFMSGVTVGAEPEVSRVSPNTMASEVGLQQGDRLVAVGGERVETWQGFTRIVGERAPGEKVELTITRDGTREVVSGSLSSSPTDPKQPLVGVSPVTIEENYGPIKAVGLSVERTTELVGAIGSFAWQLVTGQVSFYENVSGPIGVASAGDTLIDRGIFVPAMALISLNLAIVNLFPILPLDGGHLVLIAIEKIKGSPVSLETMGRIAVIGIALVLTVSLFVAYADVSKLLSGESIL